MDWNLKAVAWVSVLGCLCWAWKQAVPRQPSLGRVGQGPRGGEPRHRDKAETPNSAQGYEVGAPAPLGLLPGWGWEEPVGTPCWGQGKLRCRAQGEASGARGA